MTHRPIPCSDRDNVYGAVIKPIARVHPVRLINADWAPGGRQPSNTANRLELRVRLQANTIHMHHRHLLLLVSQKADTYSTTPVALFVANFCMELL